MIPEYLHCDCNAVALYVATDKLYKKFGVTRYYETVMRRNRKAQHFSLVTSNGTTFHQIVIGWSFLHKTASAGFLEYDSIGYVWSNAGLVDKSEGETWKRYQVWKLLLHEFAHVLQTERGLRYYGSVHNAGFVTCLRELIFAYTFEEFLSESYSPVTFIV